MTQVTITYGDPAVTKKIYATEVSREVNRNIEVAPTSGPSLTDPVVLQTENPSISISNAEIVLDDGNSLQESDLITLMRDKTLRPYLNVSYNRGASNLVSFENPGNINIPVFLVDYNYDLDSQRGISVKHPTVTLTFVEGRDV